MSKTSWSVSVRTFGCGCVAVATIALTLTRSVTKGMARRIASLLRESLRQPLENGSDGRQLLVSGLPSHRCVWRNVDRERVHARSAALDDACFQQLSCAEDAAAVLSCVRFLGF